MTIVILSNFFNHHQKPLADTLYRLTDGNLYFIETTDFANEQRLLGYRQYNETYVMRYCSETKEYIDHLISVADAVIFGEAPLDLVKKRLKEGKLTFRDDERRYKAFYKYLKYPIYTYNSLYLNKGYLLCASAFCANDYRQSGMSPDKCFKWGYFTEAKIYNHFNQLMAHKASHKNGKIRLLWACRFIKWKHPEMAVEVAHMLKQEGYDFELQMIGRGPLENYIDSLINQYKLNEQVIRLGAMPPDEVRHHMESADIFLATSDKNEGWGATVNESMNSGCAIVASHSIGAVPFLIKNGQNGIIFKSNDKLDLFEKVKYLIDNPEIRVSMGTQAYETITQSWNPESAAVNFIKLVKSLKAGNKNSPIMEGPCSDAPLIKNNWFK